MLFFGVVKVVTEQPGLKHRDLTFSLELCFDIFFSSRKHKISP